MPASGAVELPWSCPGYAELLIVGGTPETGAVAVVATDEEPGLLIGGCAERAPAAVADAGGAVPVTGAVVVDVGAGDLDQGAGIVEEVEVAERERGHRKVECLETLAFGQSYGIPPGCAGVPPEFVPSIVKASSYALLVEHDRCTIS